MTTLRKNILIGLAVLGMGSAALGVQAQAPTAQAPEGRHSHAASQQQHQARMADFMAKRQAKLHELLKLTPAQEPAWNSFVAATRPAGLGQHGDRAQWATLSAPARLEKMIALSKQRTAAMESQLAALNTFYAVLTPEQKKVFDQHTMRGLGRHHKGGMMHH
jgi:protein CpxP